MPFNQIILFSLLQLHNYLLIYIIKIKIKIVVNKYDGKIPEFETVR